MVTQIIGTSASDSQILSKKFAPATRLVSEKRRNISMDKPRLGTVPASRDGDVFRAERELGKLAVYLDNRAAGCTCVRQKLEQKMKRARKTGRGQNLNSRLRNYFFLRRYIGNGYLDLLRFFINHRCYIRSDRPERVGKSPAELLNSQSHPHWLELLGYQLFSQN